MEDNSTSGLLFIDVGAKPPIPVIKEERASSPDETLSDVKKREDPVKLQCGECNYSSFTAERITRHIRRAHRGENPFQCVMCAYSTYNSSLFREHVFRHQGIKPYKCKYCPYRTVSKKYIKMHEGKHGACSRCGFVGRNRADYRRHITENSCEDDGNKGRYNCTACNHSYSSKEALRQHKIKGLTKCAHCNKAMCNSLLKDHLFSEHGIEKRVVKTYKFNCAQCDFKCSWLQKILLHMIHHPEQQLDGSIDVTPLVEAGILTTTTASV